MKFDYCVICFNKRLIVVKCNCTSGDICIRDYYIWAIKRGNKNCATCNSPYQFSDWKIVSSILAGAFIASIFAFSSATGAFLYEM